jgi:FKBP-type peptidyl-prolyl cis-trans isomerase
MKKFVVLAWITVLGFAKFNTELIERYSIKIVKEGEPGTAPKLGDEILMHYNGKLEDGSEFDSSFSRGAPLPIRIGRRQVIQCWDEVGMQMNVGQKVKVICPPDNAYGSRAVGHIPANSALHFTMKRVK